MKKIIVISILISTALGCVRPRFSNVNNIAIDELGFPQYEIDLSPVEWTLYVRTTVLDTFQVSKVLKNTRIDTLDPPLNKLTPNDISASFSETPLVLEQQYLFIRNDFKECLVINNIPDTKVKMYSIAKKKNERQLFYEEQNLKLQNKPAANKRSNAMKNSAANNIPHKNWIDSTIQYFDIDLYYFNQFRYGSVKNFKDNPKLDLEFFDVQPYGMDHQWHFTKSSNNDTLYMTSFSEVHTYAEAIKPIDKSYSLPLVFIRKTPYQIVYLDNRVKGQPLKFPVFSKIKLYRKKQQWFTAFQFRTLGVDTTQGRLPVGMDEYFLFGNKTMYVEPSLRTKTQINSL